MKTRPTSTTDLIVTPVAFPPSFSRDDASLSSTLTADAPPRKPLCAKDGTILRKSCLKAGHRFCKQLQRRQQNRPQKQSTLQVRFREEQNAYHANEIFCQEDCIEFWYTNDDFVRFKNGILRTVKTLHKYESRNPTSGSISNILEVTYQCCFEQDQETMQQNILPQELSAAIKNQYRHNDEYILGLERLIVRRIGRDRSELRKCLMDIIRDLQQGEWPDRAVLAHNIARVSAEATRASRLFGRQLGSAQVPYLLTRRSS